MQLDADEIEREKCDAGIETMRKLVIVEKYKQKTTIRALLPIAS